MVYAREVLCMQRLYLAGAHLEAVARVMGRDPRTVRAILRREGIPMRREPPLPDDWRTGIAPETLTALRTALHALQAYEQTLWQQVQQQSHTPAAGVYTFPTVSAYHAALQTTPPPPSLEEVAARLGIALTSVLLAYAELEDAEFWLQ